MIKNEKETQTKNESGLPDVAEVGFQRKLITAAMLGVILTGALLVYWVSGTKAGKKVNAQTEEIYTVQSTPHLEHPVEQVSQTKAVETEPPISPELMQQQIALLQAKQKELQQRLEAPLMLVNVNQTSHASNAAKEVNTVISCYPSRQTRCKTDIPS